MGMPEENLVFLLLYSLTVGAFLGVLWDTFRIIRIVCYGKRKAGAFSPIKLPSNEKDVSRALAFSHTQKVFSPSGIAIFLSDLLFCLATTISVIILLFHLNGGEIRGFALFGAAVGFSVYYFTVGRLTVLFSDFIIKGIKKLVLLTLSVTVIPIFRLLSKPFALLLQKINVKIRKIKTNIFIKRRINEAREGFGLFGKCFKR